MTRKTFDRPDPRLGAALLAAKVTGGAIRRLGRGGGTAAPGLIADRIDPALLGKIASRLDQGVVVVAGTNGKTTVSRMIADMLEASGLRVTHNRAGSNLVRGVASALAERSTLLGDPRADAGVIESDEAALPEIVRQVRPRVLVLNNLFRDQLDRYGELAAVANRWRAAFADLGTETTLLVNADDPTLAAITAEDSQRRLCFGLDEADPRLQLSSLPHAVDAATCRRCGHDLSYDALYSAHLGAWRCPSCGLQRPSLDVAGHDIVLDGVERLRLAVTLNGNAAGARDLDLEVAIPGLYNAYNTVAAVAAASMFGVSDTIIATALSSFRTAFGRIEKIAYRDRRLVLALVKNPVGFNETLRMLTAATAGLTIPTLIAINDGFADGRDVSWLWDVDFELLAEGTAPLSTTGIRGPDMANRLKYAGVAPHRIRSLESELAGSLDTFVGGLPVDGVGYILPTYTAMLDLRRILADRGAVAAFWDQ